MKEMSSKITSTNNITSPLNPMTADSRDKLSHEENASNKVSWPLIAGIVILIGIVTWFFAFDKSKTDEGISKDVIAEPISTEPLTQEVVVQETVYEQTPMASEVLVPQTVVIPSVQISLPTLDESDDLIKTRLPSLTWRTELLKLVIDDDMIRRIVVFADNFSQGNVAYSHSPLVIPTEKLSISDDDVIQIEGIKNPQSSWQLDDSQAKRFSVYVDLLRSLDREALAKAFNDFKPLFDQAYSELGYEGDFTLVLQEAIDRVLDMEVPSEPLIVIRPSVAYKYQNQEIENLPDADKLLLRLGRENLLVIKSVLLDLSEALAREQQ